MTAINAIRVRWATAIAVAASVLVFIVPAVSGLIDRLSGRFAEFRWTPLAISFAISMIYWPVNAYVWNVVLQALGHRLAGSTAVRIWLSTQTCRWLPGGVWHYGSRTVQAVTHGIPPTVAVASMALELLLTVAAWSVLAVAGIAVFGSRQLHTDEVFSRQTFGMVLAGGLVLVALAGVAFASWRWFPQKFQAVRERFASLRLVRPRWSTAAACFLAYAVLSLLNGVAFYAVVRAVLPDVELPLLAAISANALAWIVGLVAVMAPGGLVVREATLALQLSFWMPVADAAIIAVLWRLVQIVVEVVCVAVALVPPSFLPSFSKGVLPMKLPSLRKHWGVSVLVVVTLVAATLLTWYVLRPAYMHPSNHTYTSGLGYPAVLRMRGQPFPVSVAQVTERTIRRQYLGEGLVESEPVRVPIVPEGRLARVYVKEGDYVKRGQLLAELDARSHEIQIVQSKNALDRAAVEVERARVGSPYAMAMERPEVVATQLESAKQQVEITKQLVEIYTKLQNAQSVPRVELLNQQLAASRAVSTLQEAQEYIKISKVGRPLSVQAAELALQEARLQHELYTQELADFKIHAHTDGMVAQVLVHEGEYNRNPGTSAFVLAVGKWFGGNFDQTTVGRFAEGAPVSVRLEAFPGQVFAGRVRNIKPMVTYNPGGPEAARPVRPLGTGSPEWPATFITRIELVGGDEELRDIVPGLTGFAEVVVERRSAAVPEGSLTSISAGKAIAYLVEDDSFRAQQVTVGGQCDGWIEVISGLTPGTEVIADGYQILQAGDRIVPSPAPLPKPRSGREPQPDERPQPSRPGERSEPVQQAQDTGRESEELARR